jgi:hypothetical protein
LDVNMNACTHARISFAAAIGVVLGVSSAMAAPRVVLELATEQGFPLTGQQEWGRALGELGFENLRIRPATGGEKVEVVREGSDGAPSYRVTGVLTRNNQLVLPGGRFTIRDSAQLTAWKDALVRGGPSGLDPKLQAAFGLSPEQLVAMHERLALPVVIGTQGKTPKEVVRAVAMKLPGGVTIDPAVVKAFDDPWTVPEELEGLSSGTMLAATIRPLGLVLVPQAVTEKDVRLVITDVRKAPESWPVGWPPEAPEKDLAPKLFEFFTFEAPGNPVDEALAALGPQVEVPLIYDHNGMARERIDLHKAMVKMPEARSYYKKVIDRVLFQAKMKAELRVDEAGTPFMWLSPLQGP